MKAKPGDILIPENPEQVFMNLKELIGEMPEYVHTMTEYEVLDIRYKTGRQPMYIILGMPTISENDLVKVFGKYKVK